MTEAKTKDVEETPPGYPEGWQPEEIRTIEPLPLPEDQQPEKPLAVNQQVAWDKLQSEYPHDPVLIERDGDTVTFVTPDGKEHKAPKAIEDTHDEAVEAKTESKSTAKK